jgi:hypothetical protein
MKKTKKQATLYYAKTGYHLILSSCLARDRGDKSLLVISPRSNYVKEICMAVKEMGIFDRVKEIENGVAERSWVGRFFDRKEKAKKVMRWVTDYGPKKVTTCRIGTPVGAAIIQAIREDCICEYLEDGALDYSSAKFSRVRVAKNILRSTVYPGREVTRRVRGNNEVVDSVAATFPSAIRRELVNKKTQKVSPKLLKNYGKKILVRVLQEDQASCLAGRKIIVIAPILKTDRKIKLFRKSIEYAKRKYKANEISIKFHPSQSNNHVVRKIKRQNVYIINSKVPIELVYSTFPVKEVVGGISTALMSARWVDKNISVSVFVQKSHSDSRVINAFQKMGVNIIT